MPPAAFIGGGCDLVVVILALDIGLLSISCALAGLFNGTDRREAEPGMGSSLPLDLGLLCFAAGLFSGTPRSGAEPGKGMSVPESDGNSPSDSFATDGGAIDPAAGAEIGTGGTVAEVLLTALDFAAVGFALTGAASR